MARRAESVRVSLCGRPGQCQVNHAHGRGLAPSSALLRGRGQDIAQSEHPHLKPGPPFLLGLRGGICKMVGSSSVTTTSLSFWGPCSDMRTLPHPSQPFLPRWPRLLQANPAGADQEGVMTRIQSPAQQTRDQDVPDLFPYASLDLLSGQGQVSQRAGLEGGPGGGV